MGMLQGTAWQPLLARGWLCPCWVPEAVARGGLGASMLHPVLNSSVSAS